MFPIDPKLAPMHLMVGYLAVFQRYFTAVMDYTHKGDKEGIILGGYLANALHNVPALLWHCEAQAWSLAETEKWLKEYPQILRWRGAPKRLLNDSRRILSPIGAAQDLKLRADFADVVLAPLPKMRVYLDWIYHNFLYMRMLRIYGGPSPKVWRGLEQAWSDNAETCERQANFNEVVASLFLSLPRALIQWNQFDEEQFLQEAVRAAKRFPTVDRDAWLAYIDERSRQLRSLPHEQSESTEAL